MKARGKGKIAKPAPPPPVAVGDAPAARTLAMVTGATTVAEVERHAADVIKLLDGRTVRLAWCMIFRGQLDGWFAREVFEGDRYGEPEWFDRETPIAEVLASPNTRPRPTEDNGGEVDPVRRGTPTGQLAAPLTPDGQGP